MRAIASEHEALAANLRTALETESNANTRYAEFAEKADGEGWHGIASLFRAAARAEQIHAANHARILHQLGGNTDYTPRRVEVKTTFENVRAALAGETFEVQTMYPLFLGQARDSRDVAVVRTFAWALTAEKTHTRLFNEALALLEINDEDSWITMARDFYVCPVCGYTSEDAEEADVCPACLCSWGRFEHCH